MIIPDENGDPLQWEKREAYPDRESYDLCRCGQSKHKPYCDHTHAFINFYRTETAWNKKYVEQTDKWDASGNKI